MKPSRMRFTVRRMMVGTAIVSLLLTYGERMRRREGYRRRALYHVEKSMALQQTRVYQAMEGKTGQTRMALGTAQRLSAA